jgi:hypothetical protein
MSRSAMADVQHAIPAIELLAPEDVPGAAALARRLTPALKAKCLEALAAGRPKTAVAALSREIAASPPRPWQDIRFMIDTDQASDGDTHDHYFRVRRSGHKDPLGYLRGLSLALDRLVLDLSETPTTLEAAAIAAIGDALRQSVAAALSAPAPAAGFCVAQPEAPLRPDFAKWRWLRGHHIFASLTQALIFSLDGLEVAREGGDEAALRAAAELCRSLLVASARAFELTGDFPPEIYGQSIRASMDVPYQPKGFSGLLSSDHRQFVSRMRAARPTIEYLRDVAPDAHANILAGLALVYDSHKHVCDRFVGADQASLLMASECSRSAVSQIDRFKQMRLRAWR